MTNAPQSDLGPAVAVPDFDAFVERELAFCGYLVLAPIDALLAEEIETARRLLWEEWRESESCPYGKSPYLTLSCADE